MHKKIIKYLFLIFFAAMTICMLLYSGQSLRLALEGLNLWFTKMIPALLPFMILSGTLILTGLSDSFAALFAPVLKPVFQLSDSCVYCLIIGFLCGFPMGARVCAQSYEKGKLSYREASLILAFCNNIGPIYFTGFVLPLFPVKKPALVLIGMYGLPLLYGLFLRYTTFRQIPLAKDVRPPSHTSVILPGQLLSCLHESILSALDGITALGGYMIFCNLLNLIPQLMFADMPVLLQRLGPLLEITGGLSKLPSADTLWAYIVLPFGGLSCIAQTYSCIKNTDLSIKEYIFHKVILTILTAAFYGFLPIR